MSPEPSAYDKGVTAGEIGARLAGHDKHFAEINGSVKDLKDEMHQLVLGVQRLGDAADADRATVKTTAAALKDAEEARRDSTDQRWSPKARLIATVVAFAAAIEAVILIYNSLK